MSINGRIGNECIMADQKEQDRAVIEKWRF